MHDSRGRLSPILKGPGPSAKRDEALAELSAFASSLLPEPPKTLRAAGALVLRATPAQARELAAHPLVKAIRPNRRLRP